MKPTVLQVEVPGASYEVVIGPGVLEDVGKLVRIVSDARKVAIITDGTVGELFGLTVERKLIEAGFEVHPLSVAPGEASKSWAVAGEVLEALAELRLGRDDLVVALGGGVVGDLAGFAAATYLRGIGYVQVPTTLLAQVDSSVGGKTGVDLRAGKNLAGAFKQPMLVVADTAVLESLPGPEWGSGLAEIAKSAIIDGEEFTEWIEKHSALLASRDGATTSEAVRRAAAFKASVVSQDEKESGDRECLNYGHTFGHALENVAGYGAIPHGIAVAEGIRFASRLAVEVVGAPRDFVQRQCAILDDLGIPALDVGYPAPALVAAMRADKKVRLGAVRFVLATSPGTWSCMSVPDNVISDHVEAWSASKRKAG
jgi:3-dehydroquinate synthase